MKDVSYVLVLIDDNKYQDHRFILTDWRIIMMKAFTVNVKFSVMVTEIVWTYIKHLLIIYNTSAF